MGEYAIKYLCALYINVYVCVQLFFCAIKRKIPVFYMLFQDIAVFQIVYHMKYPCRKEGMRK